MVKEATKSKDSNTLHSLYVSSLPPPILVKLAKEINEMSKYFKKQQPTNHRQKSYMQILAKQFNPTNVARKMLKIKETFPNLQNKKIKIVQKIISSQDKPKPKISMTTKGPSCKQVIIPIKGDDANNFIKDLSMHVININQTLKNIKSSIIVDYICIDSKDIIITTNSIASPSDLQAIKKYVKSASSVDADQVQSLQLP